MKVVAYGDTNVGKIRENNEDNFLILDIENGKTGNITEPNPGRVYLVVADGMGGAAAGEKASAIVIEASMKSALELKDKSPQEVNVFSLVKAQESCLDLVKERKELLGMGSVATYAYFKQNKIFVSQVGDTRLYLYRNKTLEQITEDQNFVTELVKLGIITKEQAEFHPQRNAVTQAIGAVDEVVPVFHELEVKSGDRLLICSDGLTGMLSDIEIQLILDGSNELNEIVSILIDTANANGGHDNITVILAEFLE